MAIQFKDGKPLIVMGKVAMNSACCCGGTCKWYISAAIGGFDSTYPHYNLYGKAGAGGEVIHKHNVGDCGGGPSLSEEGLCFNGEVGEGLEVYNNYTGNRTVNPVAYYFWYNQPTNDNAEGIPTPFLAINIFNPDDSGQDICVNGTTLAPGQIFTINEIEYAGYNNGDQSGYAGGTEVVITCGACP